MIWDALYLLVTQIQDIVSIIETYLLGNLDHAIVSILETYLLVTQIHCFKLNNVTSLYSFQYRSTKMKIEIFKT